MRDLDKELLRLKIEAVVVMFGGWVFGLIGAHMVFGMGGFLMAFGFPMMLSGMMMAKNVIEAQVRWK